MHFRRSTLPTARKFKKELVPDRHSSPHFSIHNHGASPSATDRIVIPFVRQPPKDRQPVSFAVVIARHDVADPNSIVVLNVLSTVYLNIVSVDCCNSACHPKIRIGARLYHVKMRIGIGGPDPGWRVPSNLVGRTNHSSGKCLNSRCVELRWIREVT